VSTGTPGLDAIIGGGFLQSGVYILQGAPGAGKTILANQIVHRYAAAGGRVVYVTMLAESHARLLQHMQAFSFFDAALVPEQVYYVSAFNALRSEGLKGVVQLLRDEMRTRDAGIVVLDGLVMAASAARNDEELKLFVSEIQAHSTLTGSTTLLLASERADRPESAEQTMVDGILLMRERAFGPRRERNIEIAKFRGSSTLRGNHAFEIGPDGITVYPRLEAVRREDGDDGVLPIPVSSGIPGLDGMFDIGGFGKGSITVVSGPSGSGKTSLSLHFVAQATLQDKALFFSFYEAAPTLLRMMDLMGVQRPPVGSVEFMWQPFGENILDGMAASLLQRVKDTGATRLVIDGIGGFMAAPAFADRGGPFFATLMNQLRRMGVTTLVTVEENDATGKRNIDTPTMSALCDAVLEKVVRSEGSIRRYIAIRKSRISRCDLRVRELVLTPRGIDVSPEDPRVVP
jgi:circadian clock protein KaiC